MSEKPRRPWWIWPLIIVSLPILLAGAVVWLAVALCVLVAAWVLALPTGRYTLVVYSNSPIWQEYFEQRVLPHVAGRAVVLNWSERKRWRLTLPVMLFRIVAGSRNHTPIAMVFRPFRWPRTFRFYQPFRAFKHGNPTEVECLREALLTLLDDLDS